MEAKEKRNLSGIWFRYKNPITNQVENRVFEDLPEDEQRRQLENRSIEWLQNMCVALAGILRQVGDDFNLISE